VVAEPQLFTLSGFTGRDIARRESSTACSLQEFQFIDWTLSSLRDALLHYAAPKQECDDHSGRPVGKTFPTNPPYRICIAGSTYDALSTMLVSKDDSQIV